MSFVVRSSAECLVVIKVLNTGEEYRFGPNTDYPFLTNVSVVQKFNLVESITFEIDMPFYEGRELLNSNAFTNGNIVKVVMGYGETRTNVFTGLIHEGGSGLSIEANGVSGSIDAIAHSTEVDKVKTFPKKQGLSNYDYLLEIVGTANVKLIVEPPSLVNEINTHEAFEINGSKSPVDAIREFCSRYGYVYSQSVAYQDGQKSVDSSPTGLEIKLIKADGVSRPDGQEKLYLFIMRGAPFGTEELRAQFEVYPIMAFSPEETGPLFGRQTKTNVMAEGVQIGEVDKEGKAMEVSVDLSQSSAVNGGQKDLKNNNSERAVDGLSVGSASGGARIQSPTPEGSEASVRARALALNENSAIEYSASLTTVGIPNLSIYEKCAVVGLGKIYDGVFSISGFTHTWNGGSIETQISLFSRSSEVLRVKDNLNDLLGVNVF